MDLSQRALQTIGKLFSNFEFVFEFLAENQIKKKRIVRHKYLFNYNVLYINGFVLKSSTNYWKVFFFKF